MFKYALFLLLYVSTLTKPRETTWKVSYLDPEYENKKLVLQIVKKDSLYEVYAINQPNDKIYFRFNDKKRQLVVEGEEIDEQIAVDNYIVIPPKFDSKQTKTLQTLQREDPNSTPLVLKRRGKKILLEQDRGIFAEYGEIVVE